MRHSVRFSTLFYRGVFFFIQFKTNESATSKRILKKIVFFTYRMNRENFDGELFKSRLWSFLGFTLKSREKFFTEYICVHHSNALTGIHVSNYIEQLFEVGTRLEEQITLAVMIQRGQKS